MTSFHPVVFVDVCRMMHLSLNTSQSQGTGKHIRRLRESIYRATSATLLAILLEQRFSPGQDTRRHIIYRNLPGTDLGDFRIGYIFNTVDHGCLEKLPFVDEFFHTLRIGFRAIREALIITGLARGIRAPAFRFVLPFHVTTKARHPPKETLIPYRPSLQRASIPRALTFGHE
jgi:hypothetical protein